MLHKSVMLVAIFACIRMKEKMEILLKHRGKNITIGIWHPEKTTLFINRSLYPYLETLVAKYKVKL